MLHLLFLKKILKSARQMKQMIGKADRLPQSAQEGFRSFN